MEFVYLGILFEYVNKRIFFNFKNKVGVIFLLKFLCYWILIKNFYVEVFEGECYVCNLLWNIFKK